MRRVVAISLTLLVCSAEASDLCKLTSAPAEKKVKINGVPGFFFKVHPDGDHLTFIEAEHNTLIDLNSGIEHPTVGNIDPVWSPDAKFLTHPGEEGLRFYHGNEILEATKKGMQSSAKSWEVELGGVYQSIGAKDGKYKIISDQDGVSIAEYEFGKNGPKQISKVERPCSNIENMPTDLPMISKDGRFISVYDQESKSTKIFKFHGKECELALDLGYGTGKVSFNPDSSQIAFHVDQFSDFEDGYFSGVGKDKVKNVMVLNLEESKNGSLVPVSWALASHHTQPGDGGYYPDFDKHGNIYFLEDIGNNFQIVKVSPKNLEFRNTEEDLLFGKKNCASCEEKSSKTPSAPSILAGMWKDMCGKESLLGIELISGVDPEACKNMVHKFYVPSLGVPKETLLKTCPSKTHQNPVEVGEWQSNQKELAESLLKGKCISCHRQSKTFEAEEYLTVQTGPEDYVDEKIKYKKKMGPIKLETMDAKLAGEMLHSILTQKMPKKDPLTEEQRKLITNYLQKRLLDLDQNNEGNDYTYVRRYTEEHLEHVRETTLAGYPTLTDPQKEAMKITLNCLYGQKNCTEYLEMQRPLIEAEANKLPESERQNFWRDKMLELKCQNLIEVTPYECVEHDQRKNQR